MLTQELLIGLGAEAIGGPGDGDGKARSSRKVFKIGCAFDWDVRNLGQWIVAGA